jgi:hypothetical protein
MKCKIQKAALPSAITNKRVSFTLEMCMSALLGRYMLCQKSHISGCIEVETEHKSPAICGFREDYCAQPFVLGTWYYNVHPMWKITVNKLP